MYKEDPDLTDSFGELVKDSYPEINRESLYIHWHPTVSEYCIYIDDKWSGYVDEEYIFKAGFDLYKQWSSAWERSKQDEIYYELIRRYIKTCVEFLKDESSSESSRMDSVRWFIHVVRHHRVLPKDYQDHALERIIDWCSKVDFTTGVQLLEQEVENDMAEETPQRRNRKIRSED